MFRTYHEMVVRRDVMLALYRPCLAVLPTLGTYIQPACYSEVTVIVTVVLQWCYSDVTVMLQWCYRGSIVMLH
jgi:hypothetical protein